MRLAARSLDAWLLFQPPPRTTRAARPGTDTLSRRGMPEQGDKTGRTAPRGEGEADRPARATAVEAGFACWLWLDARVTDFPTSARRQLGHRALDATLDALSATTEASYLRRGPARVELLASANRKLALLRILLRGARERRHISVGQHEHAMKLVDAWGRQLGGWLRAERAAERDGGPVR